MVKYVLGKGSKHELEGVHPDLVRVVQRAITITSVDFVVYDGLRTIEEQAELKRNGASWTMNSRHLTGHAVDLVPFVNGGPRWDWPLCYKIAATMRHASILEKVPLIWGGVWDRVLGTIRTSPERACAEYVIRVHRKNKLAKIDGPHFELPRALYK